MFFSSKTILTGLSPNITRRDTLTAMADLFFPWKWFFWNKGVYGDMVVNRLKNYFSVPYAFVIDSGRSALFVSLRALGIQVGDEVLVQAYTCVVVVNAIRYVGAIPIYIDIGDDFCLDSVDIKKKITTKTKAIIVQHTFGQAADMDGIMPIAKEHGLFIIEDCAHAFGATYQGKKVGTFGDVAIFSFGSDKVLSCARGGALITNDATVAGCIAHEISVLSSFPTIRMVQHLLHFPFFYLGRLVYGYGIGKLLLFCAKKIHVINRIIDKSEKRGRPPLFFPTAFPNALAEIAFAQIQEVEKINAHRKQIANMYADALKKTPSIILPPKDEGSIYLRYTIRIDSAINIRNLMKKKHVHLGDWYDTVIAPNDCDMNATGYMSGSCPTAEQLTLASLNLPTDRYISEQDVHTIIDTLHACLAIQSNK